MAERKSASEAADKDKSASALDKKKTASEKKKSNIHSGHRQKVKARFYEISTRLQKELPRLRGFSPRNIKLMRHYWGSAEDA